MEYFDRNLAVGIELAILSPEVQRFPFQLEWAINQSFEIEHFLYKEVERLEEWLLAGKLDNVSSYEPKVSEEDLQMLPNQGQS